MRGAINTDAVVDVLEPIGVLKICIQQALRHQCMGTNIMRLGMSPLIRSRATSEPQRVIPGMVEEDLVRLTDR